MVRVAVTLFLLMLAPSAANAEKRVALVVGMAAYEYAGRLANPLNDARDMGTALSGLGFQMILGTDLTKQALDLKVREFARALEGADVGVFFYAGHGLQVKGVNYLVATDAKLEAERDLDFETLRVDLVLSHMEREAKTNIVFLDACRNNPLARNLARTMGTRGVDENNGLAPIKSGLGTFIAFATQPGNVASDGAGRNSPFTGPLKKHITERGLSVFDLMIEVRNEVVDATKGAQVPWDHHALRGRFYFNAGPQTVAPTSVSSARLSEAAEAWSASKDTTSTAVLEVFIARYKDTFYAELARARIEELKKQQVAITTPPAVSKPARCDGVEVAVGANERKCLKQGSGESFKDCPDCPEMVVVPAGNFMMGSPEGEPERGSSEGPQHNVTIARPFAVGKFAVTFAEWDACMAGGGCGGRGIPGRGDKPVLDVGWDEAKAYLAWLSKKTSKSYRLPSEAEHEYVTRAGTTTPFWWGSSISPDQANYDGDFVYAGGGQKGGRRLGDVSVKSFKPNPWGLYQVHGNVAELVEDCWNGNYDGAPSDGSTWTAGNCLDRVIRGGCFNSRPGELRSAYRNNVHGSRSKGRYIGFRVARTLD